MSSVAVRWMLVLALCVGGHAPRPAAAGPGAVEGTAADFERSALDGTPIRMADWRGKVVLINFWATWCAPCLIEMPRFSDWQRQYAGQGLQVLGISMDDSVEPVKRLLNQRGVSYPVIMGDTKLARLFGGVTGLPSSFVIDRTGRIVARYRGEVDLVQLESLLKTQLAAQKP